MAETEQEKIARLAAANAARRVKITEADELIAQLVAKAAKQKGHLDAVEKSLVAARQARKELR